MIKNPGFDDVAAICGQHVESDTVTVIECDVEVVPTGSQTDSGDKSGELLVLAVHWTIVDHDPVIPRSRVDLDLSASGLTYLRRVLSGCTFLSRRHHLWRR